MNISSLTTSSITRVLRIKLYDNLAKLRDSHSLCRYYVLFFYDQIDDLDYASMMLVATTRSLKAILSYRYEHDCLIVTLIADVAKLLFLFVI